MSKKMIPLGDDNSARKSTPIVTYILLALNIFVFFLEIAGGEEFIMKWSFIPKRFLADPSANIPTLFTAMFMHAGWGHLIGNMLYLWIFGDNVEDHFGKIKYVIFYLLSGLAATFAQLYFNPQSNVPNLGASGAIAGILGAYILLFPKGRINVMLGRSVTQMSALAVIGFWFFLQFVSGVATTASTAGDGEGGGVAYMAHIGGFVTGFAMALLFRYTDRLRLG
jgi:membrane associated rhomboid family serine protease